MTLSLHVRPDDCGGLRSLEKWPNSGWSNQHPIFEASMNPLYFPQQHLQSQSMFPQLMEQQALVQAFAQQTNADHAMLDSSPGVQHAREATSLDTLLKSSNSSSMADSTSEDECTAPENLQMNCISSLGGGSMLPVLQTSLLDRTANTVTSLRNAKYGDYLRMDSPGGPLSPNALPRGESEDSLAGSDAVATLKRRLEEEEGEWMEQIHHGARAKLHKVGVEAFSQPVDMPPFSDPAITTVAAAMPPPPPFLQPANGRGGGSSPVEVDKLATVRAILFRHASQPVPTLEEIASTRPKRRNVRISKDPQSVAARLRRERISDRIRVLQRLVPGGTKMDTASMLDEAIHYVKFLKLQLQALEQIGNSNDPRGLVQQQPSSQLPSLVHPFDLNCTQAWPAPPTSMVNNLHHNQASLPQGLSASWPNEAFTAYSDAMQEQFCN